jgi:hypothetical protein
MDCAAQTVRKDGVKALFKGFAPAMARAFPANAATFVRLSSVFRLFFSAETDRAVYVAARCRTLDEADEPSVLSFPLTLFPLFLLPSSATLHIHPLSLRSLLPSRSNPDTACCRTSPEVLNDRTDLPVSVLVDARSEVGRGEIPVAPLLLALFSLSEKDNERVSLQSDNCYESCERCERGMQKQEKGCDAIRRHANKGCEGG